MAYIGNSPIIGNFQKCDALTASSTASYTLQVGGTNVSPESVNHMLVSLNGILQAPTTSFTVSGSTLTFASTLTSSDSIDFVILLGNVLDLGVPSDATVTAAKLNNDIISGTTALASEPADTDEFLVSDAGTLKRIDYSLIKGGGITMADIWRHTTSLTISTESTATAWERPDETSNSLACQGYIAGMTHSSGTFTFPETGIYLVRFMAKVQWGDQSAIYNRIYFKKDNSNYTKVASGDQYESSGYNSTVPTEALLDVTNTSLDKVQFRTGESGAATLLGNTDFNQTTATFIRLGDT